MTYTPLFRPATATPRSGDETPTGFGDVRERADYEYYTPQISLAVNVALATARPLLVRGPAGSGKSSLAPDVARHLRWDYFEEVISSRTQARDLLWQFDAVRRLRDAQAGRSVDSPDHYVRPGILWWAVNPTSAAQFAPPPDGAASAGTGGAVVLLDEIDKAEPDTPNDLLVPLGSGTFTVTDLHHDDPRRLVSPTRPAPPLIIITTNEERDLPKAFERRCVVLTLQHPTAEQLVRIARTHFGTGRRGLYTKLAHLTVAARARAKLDDAPGPSTAEFLDAIQACRELGVAPGAGRWAGVALATLEKWVREPDRP